MKRTSLWTNRSLGLVCTAAALALVAAGAVLFTQGARGQASDGDASRVGSLSRREVGELLATARAAIRDGRLDQAEQIIARTEQANVDYPLFYPGDTPKKARRALQQAQSADDSPVRRTLPNPLAGLVSNAAPDATDPFAERDNAVATAVGDGTALPGPNAYAALPPHQVSMPTPPPIDQPLNLPSPSYSQTAQAPSVPDLGPGDVPLSADLYNSDRYRLAQTPQITTGQPGLSQGQSLSPPIQTNPHIEHVDPARTAAARTSLRDARLALAVGDVRRAKEHLQQAKSLNVGQLPGRDGVGSVQSAIVRYEQLVADQKRLGGDAAWRRHYGTVLCEQAGALIEYGNLDDAERLVTDAANLGVSYGPYEVNPQQVLRQITEARQATRQPSPMQDTIGHPEQPAVDSQFAAAKQQALRLLAASRAALAGGDIRQAESLVAEAAALGVPPQQFAVNEDHPTLVTLDIQKAKMARAQRASDGGPSNLSSDRPQLALEVQQSLYTPEADTSSIVTAAGSEPELLSSRVAQNVPTPAPLPNDAQASPVQSEAARLLSAGEAALRNGDRNEALRLFQDAYESRSELDPFSVQRLQGHLQMLSSSSLPTPGGQNGGSLIDAASQSEQVLLRQLSADLTRRQSDARRIRESDPRGALRILEEASQSIKGANLSQSVKAQLLRRVELSIADTEDYIEQNRAQLELDAKNRDVLAEVERRRQGRLDLQQRIADLVDQFNQLQDEQRYDEMEVVAQRLYELAPEEQVAQMAWTTAKARRRAKLNQILQSDKEEAVFATFQAVEDSAIPFPDDNPFRHGYDAHGWESLTTSRREQRQRRSRLTDRELEIQRKLQMPIHVNYVDRPLQEVISDLMRITSINIHLDDYGLGQEAVRTDTAVTLPLQQEISLKSVLNLILEPLHLDYVIQDEVLKITSQQRAQGATYSQVYDVADLVIPIPNFVPSSNFGLQGLINDAHATAAGYWLNGSNSISLVNNDRSKGGTTLANEVMAQQLSSIPGVPGPHSPTVPISSGAGSLGGGAAADFDSLITLIQTTVAAESWTDVGGPGSIEPFATNLSLVISQTQEVHEEIADLLEQLRRLQDLQVTIEVRFITLSDNFFEQIGVDFDFLVEDGPGVIEELRPGPGNPVPGQRVEGRRRSATVGLLPATDGSTFPTFTSDLDVPFTQESLSLAMPQFGTPVNVAQFGFAILSDLEAYFIVQAAQGDRRSNVLEAPKVTLFNGQVAFVTDTSSRPFVTSVIPVVGDFAAAQQPVIVVLSEGTMLSIQAVVSDDRRYVRMTVVPFFSQIGDVQEFTFEGSTTTTSGSSSTDDDDDGNNESQSNNMNTIRTGTTVQLPTFEVVSVSTTVSVPDGGTVLLGGIKRLSEGRNEFGVPLLSKIPYVSRLFRNVGIGRQTQSLMMMVTPRIIIQEEEEARLLGTPVAP